MSTIPDDLSQLARELENIQEAWNSGNHSKTGHLCAKFCDYTLDDAIKIISDAEERIVMLEARTNE